MKKFWAAAGFVFLSMWATAQHYFIRTDLAGYSYKAVWPRETGPATGPKFSLACEKGFSRSGTSVAVQLNYGYLPYMRLGYDINSTDITDVMSYKGFFLQPEWRYYFAKKKRAEMCVFFAGGYLHFFTGKIQSYFLSPVAPGYSGSRFSYERTWMLGGGVACGYKQMIARHFYIEPLIGMGYGYMHRKNMPADERKFNAGNFLRAELSAGYAF